MRKEFSTAMEKYAAEDKRTIFITGDLGFMALENVRDVMKERFINAGVSEQNMISLAAGLASQGLRPVCYSIAPFLIFRPAEQIRLDICLHNMDVKLVGNGGGYGYGIMGATHHAIEDIAVVSSFQNMRCYIPVSGADVSGAFETMMEMKGPAYMRLGAGVLPAGMLLPQFAPVRRLVKGAKITVAALGPAVLNVLNAVGPENKISADIFVVSEIPFEGRCDELFKSISATGKLLMVEEHVKRGGMGESLSLMLLDKGISAGVRHLHAAGYPGGTYGSQSYHQKISGLDPESILKKLKELL
jgi:transketolase